MIGRGRKDEHERTISGMPAAEENRRVFVPNVRV